MMSNSTLIGQGWKSIQYIYVVAPPNCCHGYYLSDIRDKFQVMLVSLQNKALQCLRCILFIVFLLSLAPGHYLCVLLHAILFESIFYHNRHSDWKSNQDGVSSLCSTSLEQLRLPLFAFPTTLGFRPVPKRVHDCMTRNTKRLPCR